MKKPARKLALHRQTLLTLDAAAVVAGAAGTTLTIEPIDTLARPSRPCPIPTSIAV
jgi:hypothetical protein